jgi:hypothetical protein
MKWYKTFRQQYIIGKLFKNNILLYGIKYKVYYKRVRACLQYLFLYLFLTVFPIISVANRRE